MKPIIVVAGGTGNLGERIIKELLQKGAEVRALVRASSNPEKVRILKGAGAKILQVDLNSVAEIAQVCKGATCVVSALSGLREVIIDAQKILLDAAVAAGVPRFIPSDFSLDFTNLKPGENRNLDLRREFHQYLDKSPIAATTIFIGPFMDLLTGEMPLILFKFNRILYWGSPDQRMDFTTMDDTAAFTANAALDSATPRFLRIAGDQLSARELAAVVSEVTGKKFGLLRAGGIGLLSALIKIAQTVSPGKEDLYPAWQGMQYMRNMADGRGKLHNLDNNRYPNQNYTLVIDFLKAYLEATKAN